MGQYQQLARPDLVRNPARTLGPGDEVRGQHYGSTPDNRHPGHDPGLGLGPSYLAQARIKSGMTMKNLTNELKEMAGKPLKSTTELLKRAKTRHF